MAGTRINILEAQISAQKIGHAAAEFEVSAQKLHNCVEKIGEHWQGQAYHKFYTLAGDLNQQLKKATECVLSIHHGVVKTIQGYEIQDLQ